MNRRRFFLKIGALWVGSIFVPKFADLADDGLRFIIPQPYPFNPNAIGVYEQMRNCGNITRCHCKPLTPQELEDLFLKPRTNFTPPDLSHLDPIQALHVPTLRDLLGRFVA